MKKLIRSLLSLANTQELSEELIRDLLVVSGVNLEGILEENAPTVEECPGVGLGGNRSHGE